MMRRSQACRGFTLVELLIGATLSAALMAAVLSTFVFLGRNLTRLANYHSLEAKSREALTYLTQDLALAQAVKSGTAPTATTVTLVLPSGEVTYTYDTAALKLRRQATFGANRDFSLLTNDFCTCTAFAFDYYTTSGGAPTSQITTATNVPYSIKQIQVRFAVETPAGYSSLTHETYSAVSSRYLVRNRQLPDGT
jgi:prepilin-type N-terminal cleavage/methylation domain-containing protein